MKSTTKILLGIVGLAFLLLLYVHEQVSLFRVSYLLDDRADTLSRLSEEYRSLKFEVDQLKAPRLLEEKIKLLSMDLTLPQEIRVVRTLAPKLEAPVQDLSESQASSRMFNMLGKWIGIAQAKTDH